MELSNVLTCFFFSFFELVLFLNNKGSSSFAVVAHSSGTYSTICNVFLHCKSSLSIIVDPLSVVVDHIVHHYGSYVHHVDRMSIIVDHISILVHRIAQPTPYEEFPVYSTIHIPLCTHLPQIPWQKFKKKLLN